MRVVVIYGPPGAGKLTVGSLLARKTGFKLVHTHQLADAILPLFPFHAREFLPLLSRLRAEFVKAAVKSPGVHGVVVAGLYSPVRNYDLTDRFLRRLARMPGVRLDLVRLMCDRRELFRRIRLPSRRAFRKTRDRRVVALVLKRFRVDEAMKGRKGLEIDNTCISPGACARRIMRDLGLRSRS